MCKCRCNKYLVEPREAPTASQRQVETIAVMAKGRTRTRGRGRTEKSDEHAVRRTIEDKFGDTSEIREGRNEKREEKGEEWEGMLAGFPFFLSSRPSLALLRFVPQVESFQRILCATGAPIYKRERERGSTLRNESGVDGMNKGGGGDTLSLSPSPSPSFSPSLAQTDTCSMFSKLRERRKRGGKLSR